MVWTAVGGGGTTQQEPQIMVAARSAWDDVQQAPAGMLASLRRIFDRPGFDPDAECVVSLELGHLTQKCDHYLCETFFFRDKSGTSTTFYVHRDTTSKK
jgi:hypothetical protein